MSKVNKYNYEAVLLDFAEGRLSAKETSDLFDFLAAHPELQEDFDAALEMTAVQDDEDFSFSRKNSLLKDESQEIIQNLIIANVEGVASNEELNQLVALQKSNEDVKFEIQIFSKLKLTADESQVFSRKDMLTKRVVIPFTTLLYRASFAAAASVLLLLMFNGNVENYTDKAQNRIEQLELLREDSAQIKPEITYAADKIEDSVTSEQNIRQGYNSTQKRIIKSKKVVFQQNDMASFEENIAPRIGEDLVPMETMDASSLDIPTNTTLASFEAKEPKNEIVKEKNPRFINAISEQSPRINMAYGFAGEVNNKMKSFADDFQQYNELELQVFGMRTTIRKPSWMNWRRQKVKSE